MMSGRLATDCFPSGSVGAKETKKENLECNYAHKNCLSII